MQKFTFSTQDQYLIQTLDSGQMYPFINSSSHLHKRKHFILHPSISLPAQWQFPFLLSGTHYLIDSSAHTHWFIIHIDSFIRSSTQPRTHSFSHPFIHLFIHLPPPQKKHLLMYIPTQTLIDSPILLLNHTLFLSSFLSLNHTLNFPATETQTKILAS